MSDLRIVKGTAIYDSDITVPTSPLTNVSGTGVLTLNNQNDIYDIVGSYPQGPLSDIGTGPTASNTQRKFSTSSSVYFAGSSGNYLYKDLGEAVGTRDWTIEAWVYPTGTAGSGVIQISPTSGTGLLGLGSSGSIGFGQQNGYWRVYTTGGWPVTGYLQSSTAVTINAWYHVCLLYTSPSPRDRTRSRMPSSA